MNNNAVIQAGIELVNKSKQAAAEQEVAALVCQIAGEVKKISLLGESIKLEQDAVKKLSRDLITQEDVFGTVLTELNQNEATIAKVIHDLNKSKQGQIELKSQVHVQRIDQAKDAIVHHQNKIAEIRVKLSQIKVDEVTTTEVLG